jgi:hypothetical protein
MEKMDLIGSFKIFSERGLEIHFDIQAILAKK